MIPSTPLTISYGDDADQANSALDYVLETMRECGASLELEAIACGEDLYRREIETGMLPESFESIKRSKILLKSFTKTPKGNYVDVTTAICQQLEIGSYMEYYTSQKTGGIAIIAEQESAPISKQNIADIYQATQKFGGKNIAYSIDDMRLMFEEEAKNHQKISAEFHDADYLNENFADFDVVFTSSAAAKKLIKEVKPLAGCKIFLGNGYAIFEAQPDYNKENNGLMLAAALILKYFGQSAAAWAVFEQIYIELG